MEPVSQPSDSLTLSRQREFAAHIRDPSGNPGPEGIEDRRMAIYRDLFFRNIEGFIRGGFPVLHSLLPEAHWLAMVRDFIARHQCQTPYFSEIGQEFVHYLRHTRGEQPGDPVFMEELAHYEWVELALDVSENEPDWDSIDPNGDVLKTVPVISPTAWSLAYRYPVHRIGKSFQPREAPGQATYLLVYRDRLFRVKFMELNAVTARLLEIVETGELSGGDALSQLASEMQHPEPAQIIRFGADIFAQLHERGILLGCRLG